MQFLHIINVTIQPDGLQIGQDMHSGERGCLKSSKSTSLRERSSKQSIENQYSGLLHCVRNDDKIDL